MKQRLCLRCRAGGNLALELFVTIGASCYCEAPPRPRIVTGYAALNARQLMSSFIQWSIPQQPQPHPRRGLLRGTACRKPPPANPARVNVRPTPTPRWNTDAKPSTAPKFGCATPGSPWARWRPACAPTAAAEGNEQHQRGTTYNCPTLLLNLPGVNTSQNISGSTLPTPIL